MTGAIGQAKGSVAPLLKTATTLAVGPHSMAANPGQVTGTDTVQLPDAGNAFVFENLSKLLLGTATAFAFGQSVLTGGLAAISNGAGRRSCSLITVADAGLFPEVSVRVTSKLTESPAATVGALKANEYAYVWGEEPLCAKAVVAPNTPTPPPTDAIHVNDDQELAGKTYAPPMKN